MGEGVRTSRARPPTWCCSTTTSPRSSGGARGRRIFDNIRKFIKYTMSSNSGEIWTLFLAPFLGLPIPLLPIHILWINLVTDGLPGLAFTAEPANRDHAAAAAPPKESIFAHGMWQHILWVIGLLIGGLSIGAQAWAIASRVEYWQTVVFTVLTCRSSRSPSRSAPSASPCSA
jgi:Ca2+-transporting ATPase